MPIFEFRCDSCQWVFEHLALGRDEVLDLRCPQCGAETVSRVMSTCAAVVGESGSAPAAGGAQLQNRSCGKASSCSTLTLPGHTR